MARHSRSGRRIRRPFLTASGFVIAAGLAVVAIAWGTRADRPPAAHLPDGSPTSSASALPLQYGYSATAPTPAAAPASSPTATPTTAPVSAPTPTTAPAPVPVPAATACFTITSTYRCGTTSPTQNGALPSSLMQAVQECGAGTIRSPIGCALAGGRVPLGMVRGTAPAGQYWAWLASGDLFACPTSDAPTLGAGCAFAYRTVGSSWGLPTNTCPPAESGTVTLNGRVPVTLGIGTGTGSRYKAEGAMIDTGATVSYLLESQLAGTAAVQSSGPIAVIFPLIAGGGVGGHLWSVPLAVLDGSTWVRLGTVSVEGMDSAGAMIGDGLGTDAMTNLTLDTNGRAYTLRFTC